MRRLVLILLMFFLALQWSTAAVAACCLNELQRSPGQVQQVTGATHHHHEAGNTAAAKSAPEKSKTTDKHDCCAQCHACHAHGVAVLLSATLLFAEARPAIPVSLDVPLLSDVLPDNLYRPPLAHAV